MNPISTPIADGSIPDVIEDLLPTTSSAIRHVTAVYQIQASHEAAEEIAAAIALEQTVEIPRAMADQDPRVRQLVGQIESLSPVRGTVDRFLCRIAYQPQLAGGHLPQLLNLLYGNVSLLPQVKLLDFELPPDVLAAFPGPRYGVEGVRKLLGVYGRPLLATALKPVGISNAELADLAYQFSRGGGDLVKDDHNLHWTTRSAFRDRIRACQNAVQRANAQTGRNTLYLPHVCAPAEELAGCLEDCRALGIRGLLVPPFLLGLDTIRSLAEREQFVLMAHPTFGGAYSVSPEHGLDCGLVTGKLMRLMGADLSIFPNHGGRFPISEADCRRIQQELQTPWGHLAPAWPAPAGGMRWETLHQLAEFGPDAVWLVGGALLSHSENLERSTREFLQRMEQHFTAELRAPQLPSEMASACELPGTTTAPATLREYLPAQEAGRWEGRDPITYKTQQTLPFEGITRQELIGRTGEQTAFDLRYFEIAPAGYSSRERHQHTHTIIGVRGTGVLQIEDRSYPIRPQDLAYVPPGAAHQLRNEGTEAFGFYCIVDHQRDVPVAP